MRAPGKRSSPSDAKTARIQKKWKGWFKPRERSRREGPILVAPVEILPNKDYSSSVIVTVPRACGNSVQRNRFRRIVKAHFNNESMKRDDQKVLWIRLSNRHRLGHKILTRDWEKFLEAATTKSSFSISSSASTK